MSIAEVLFQLDSCHIIIRIPEISLLICHNQDAENFIITLDGSAYPALFKLFKLLIMP